MQMNLPNQEERGWQSKYQRQKIANESAECREKRLLNQCQYQNETKRIIVFTWAFCWK